MGVLGLFDAMFVNQLFGANERGETIFYPNGLAARGYLVPPEREPGLRSALRWLVAAAMFGSIACAAVVPRLIEHWLGYEIPLPYFIVGAVVGVVAAFFAILRCLKRLTVGLPPAP
jgi:drug/metabolite transporter (DMT)-like permease